MDKSRKKAIFYCNKYINNLESELEYKKYTQLDLNQVNFTAW